jgi:hypothetical protein
VFKQPLRGFVDNSPASCPQAPPSPTTTFHFPMQLPHETTKGHFLANQAPEGANAIIGIQISTSSQQFTNGTFLYLTAVGTPIIYEKS